MGYQNYLCQCNCFNPTCSTQKTIIPFNPSIPNFHKCTSFIPGGCFPYDKLCLVCCQKCVIKCSKKATALLADFSSSSTSVSEQNPCCCINQCTSCMTKRILKQSRRRGKRKSREKSSSIDDRVHSQRDKKEQSSDYESTERSHSQSRRPPSHHRLNHRKKELTSVSKDKGNRRSQKTTRRTPSSSKVDVRNNPRKAKKQKKIMYDESSGSEYCDQLKNKSANQNTFPQSIIKRFDDAPPERKSTQPRLKRHSAPSPKSGSFGRDKDNRDLRLPQLNYSYKTKSSKNPQNQQYHIDKGNKSSQVSWKVNPRETEPLFNFEPYEYEASFGRKPSRPLKKVTKREPNDSDWMRIRLEQIDQYLSKCPRPPDPCQKTCQPCLPLQTKGCQSCCYNQRSACCY